MRRVRHKQRGTTYTVINETRSYLEADYSRAVLYRSDATGGLIMRDLAQFNDGRFEDIPPSLEDDKAFLAMIRFGFRPAHVPKRYLQDRWVRPVIWFDSSGDARIGFELDYKGAEVLDGKA